MPYTKRLVHHKQVDELLEYIIDEEKTDEGLLINSLNCTPATALQEFKNNNKHWKNEGNRVAYHLIQSFHPDDPITPEQANEIGIKLCEELYPEFQCVVATHIDKGHIHNHIAINSVNINGRKLEDRLANKKEGLYGFKIKSDELAKEYGCFVMPLQKIKIEKNKNYYYEYKSQTLRATVKSDIDELKLTSTNIDDLYEGLISLGYDIKYGKQVAVKCENMKRYIRLDSLEEGYTPSDLKKFFSNKDTNVIKNLSDIQMNVTNFNEIRLQKAKQSREAIISTSKYVSSETSVYSEYQKTRYKEIQRFYQLKAELEALNEHKIYSYEDLNNNIENLRSKIRSKNEILFDIKKENKDILNKADKARDFIRLFKIKQYADYYKSIDKNYEYPTEAKIFINLQKELKIDTIDEAQQIVNNARAVRLQLNEVKSERLELQREMNKLDILKEEQLVKSNLYIHNVKFGANRIDFDNSSVTQWCVKLPYQEKYILIDKSLVTFNSKNEFYTMFLIDDKEYKIYSEDEVSKNRNKRQSEKEELIPEYSLTGTQVEDEVLKMKKEYAAKYKEEREKTGEKENKEV